MDEDTPIYNLLKSFEPNKDLIGYLTPPVISMRGDGKSIGKQRRKRNECKK